MKRENKQTKASSDRLLTLLTLSKTVLQDYKKVWEESLIGANEKTRQLLTSGKKEEKGNAIMLFSHAQYS